LLLKGAAENMPNAASNSFTTKGVHSNDNRM
jgi:hypothetical protein